MERRGEETVTLKEKEQKAMMKEFDRHDKWLEFASKCEKTHQKYIGIPSPLLSCRITKSVCDYESCPRNIWKESRVFETAEELIGDLHASRERFRESQRNKETQK